MVSDGDSVRKAKRFLLATFAATGYSPNTPTQIRSSLLKRDFLLKCARAFRILATAPENSVIVLEKSAPRRLTFYFATATSTTT